MPSGERQSSLPMTLHSTTTKTCPNCPVMCHSTSCSSSMIQRNNMHGSSKSPAVPFAPLDTGGGGHGKSRYGGFSDMNGRVIDGGGRGNNRNEELIQERKLESPCPISSTASSSVVGSPSSAATARGVGSNTTSHQQQQQQYMSMMNGLVAPVPVRSMPPPACSVTGCCYTPPPVAMNSNQQAQGMKYSGNNSNDKGQTVTTNGYPSSNNSTFNYSPYAPVMLSLRDFDLFNTLGTGTFGRVYLCRLRVQHGAFFALKMMLKSEILRLKQLSHIYSEKQILAGIRHPFIVRMYGTFQTPTYLGMLLEYAVGGELFTLLRRQGKLPVSVARFYAAEIVLALAYLHHHHQVVYRDLKPENILLDAEGHIKLTDFGFAKYLPQDMTATLCGTPEYLAPEIILGKGHGKAVDWWALGILIYEMVVGYPPFYDGHPFGIYEKILAGKLTFPEFVDPVTKDLITRLLQPDKSLRLGHLRGGALDVQGHPWFAGIQWDKLLAKQIQPPFKPTYRFDGDTANFEPYPEIQLQNNNVDDPALKELEPFQHLFFGW